MSEKLKLRFKLWAKDNLKNIKKSVFSYYNISNKIFGILITLFGLYLAFTANNLAEQGNKYSETALALAKNDNSQQIQIDKLSEILMIQKNQIDTLVEIVKELKQLNEYSRNQINRLEDQTSLLAENSRPLLRDLIYRFVPKDEKGFKGKVELITVVKNFGQRPAYNMTFSIIFIKMNEMKVESHGKRSSNAYENYQSILYPNEEREYKNETSFSQNGLTDLETVVTVVRFNYYDKPLKRTDTTTFYYEHSVLNNSYTIKTARPEIKKIIDEYLKLKKI